MTALEVARLRLPLGRRPTVHVCMRDDATGIGPEDRLWAVNITNKLGELVISLQADDLEEGYPAALRIDGDSAWLDLGDDASFRLERFDRYVGNILWDAGICAQGDARRLLKTLVERGFHVDSWTEDPQ